jgi:hypothetical protein
MPKKQNQKTFRLSTIINGNIIDGQVSFSPAPQPGILTELARFEAQRILTHMITEELRSGRLAHHTRSVGAGYPFPLVLVIRSSGADDTFWWC